MTTCCKRYLAGRVPQSSTPCRGNSIAPVRRTGACRRVDIGNPLDYNVAMLTVAEVPEYLRRSKGLLSADEREAVVAYLAANPTAGDLIRETGGVRKLRWARGGRGKSGGVRVIYYYHSDRIPLYLLTIFAKGERANLSAEEQHELAQLTT